MLDPPLGQQPRDKSCCAEAPPWHFAEPQFLQGFSFKNVPLVAVAGRQLFHLRLLTLSDQFDLQSSCPLYHNGQSHCEIGGNPFGAKHLRSLAG